jgi:ribosomal protein S18 acetylase RimI-like enzyme
MIQKTEDKHVEEISILDKIVFPGWGDRTKYIREIVEQNDSWIAVENDIIVGSVLVCNQKYADLDFPNDSRHINSIMVKEGSRNKGIGKELLNKVHKQYNHTTIHVNTSNDGAKRLYRSMGYKTKLFSLFRLTLERIG